MDLNAAPSGVLVLLPAFSKVVVVVNGDAVAVEGWRSFVQGGRSASANRRACCFSSQVATKQKCRYEVALLQTSKIYRELFKELGHLAVRVLCHSFFHFL